MPRFRPFARRALIGVVLAVTVLGLSACRPPQPTRGGFDPKAQATPPPTSSTSGGTGGSPTPPVPAMEHPPPTPAGTGAFVGRSGTSLVLNGHPWQFTGFDIYNAASRGNCGATIGAGDGFGSM